MALTISPSKPLTVFEYQNFISRHYVDDPTSIPTPNVILLDYVVNCPVSSNITITISSNILTIQGVYKGVFEEDYVEYRVSGTTTVVQRANNFEEVPEVYYMGYKYQPDRRESVEIDIWILTNLGVINTTQTVRNDWNSKRNRLIRFIKNGTANKNDFFPNVELPLASDIDSGQPQIPVNRMGS